MSVMLVQSGRITPLTHAHVHSAVAAGDNATNAAHMASAASIVRIKSLPTPPTILRNVEGKITNSNHRLLFHGYNAQNLFFEGGGRWPGSAPCTSIVLLEKKGPMPVGAPTARIDNQTLQDMKRAPAVAC